MLPKYDLNKLETALRNFNLATGVSVTVYDTDGHSVTREGANSAPYCQTISTCKEGRRACARSNKELIEKCRITKTSTRHICGAGLLDIAIPIFHQSEIVGFLMLGQIRINEELPACALSFPVDQQELRSKYMSIPLLDESRIEAIINVATMLTRLIMFENMVRSQQRQSASALVRFIDEHLSERLTVEYVAHSVHLSSAGIYKCMRQSFDCTLGEYVTAKRIERAKELLEDRDLSIDRIAEAVGFSDCAYFSRCFKKQAGCSPREYRRAQQ